jgi:hypothetical protein
MKSLKSERLMAALVYRAIMVESPEVPSANPSQLLTVVLVYLATTEALLEALE